MLNFNGVGVSVSVNYYFWYELIFSYSKWQLFIELFSYLVVI